MLLVLSPPHQMGVPASRLDRPLSLPADQVLRGCMVGPQQKDCTPLPSCPSSSSARNSLIFVDWLWEEST